MKKIVRLTESDLVRLVKRIVNEQKISKVNKVASEGIKYVTPEMINYQGNIIAEYDGYSFSGEFNGVKYVWDCQGVDGMKMSPTKKIGEIICEKNGYIGHQLGGVPNDLSDNREEVWVGFIYDDYKSGFVIYTTTKGDAKCVNFRKR